jgi:hypothetical protein
MKNRPHPYWKQDNLPSVESLHLGCSICLAGWNKMLELNRDRIGRTVPLVHRAWQSLANGETQSLIIMAGIVPKNWSNNQAVILCV